MENNKPGKKVTRSVLHRGKKHRKKNDKTNFPPIFAQFEQLLPFFSFFFFVLGRIIPSGEAAETMQETLSYGILFLLAPPLHLVHRESTEKRVYHDVVSAIQWSPLIRLNKIGKDLECELCRYHILVEQLR